MLNTSAVSTCRRLRVGLILLIGTVGSVFAQTYETFYEADEALLTKLREVRLNNWIGFQVELIKKRYADRRDDLQYIDAAFAPTRALRETKLEKISETSPRYGEAQYLIGMNKTNQKERCPYLERAYNVLKSNKEKTSFTERVLRQLLTSLVETAQIEKALKVMAESGNKDKRYLEYQSARLQLIMADRELESKGALSAKTKTMVAGVITMLRNGELFWQADMMAMLGYCELAHAYVLLGKAKDAVSALSSAFKQINEFDRRFRGNETIYSPKIPAMYYLARAYILHYKRVKDGGETPTIRGRKAGKSTNVKLTQKQAIGYYLKKAFNIFQVNLQVRKYKKSNLSKQALRDIDTVRAYMKAEGLKPPPPSAKQVESMARDSAYDFYREARALQVEADELSKAGKTEEGAKKQQAAFIKFKEAIAKFMISSKGKTSGDDIRDDFFLIAASYGYLSDFKNAEIYADKCVQYFKKDEKAWDAVNNVALKAKRAAYELRGTDRIKASELSKLASKMYMKIVKGNPTYPKMATILWQSAIDKWSEAGRLSTRKKELAGMITKLKKDKPGSPEIKKMTTELDEVVTDIKAAYMEAIPFFQILIDSYANSPYGTKAIYRIGWIYYINDDKPKAVKYFMDYCKRESTITADYLDAKYVSADILFRDGQMERAEKLFIEVIAQSAPDKIDTRSPSVKKRVNKSRTGSQALLPWIYDRKGELMLDKAQSMLDQNEELDGLIADYEVAATKNKAENKAILKVGLPTAPDVAKDAPKDFIPGKLPADFAFKDFLERTAIRVDLISLLPDDITIAFKENLLWVKKDHDVIGCVGGKGFAVVVKGKRINWDSKAVACYRDGKLVCVYDPETLQARVAKEGEAPATIELPVAIQDIPAQELEVRMMFLQKQSDANRRRFEKVRKDALALQQKGLAGMDEFLKNNKRDKAFAPTILLRMATINVSLEKWAEAEKYIQMLQKRFPKSSAADKSPIYLFRILMNAMEKEVDKDNKKLLLEKANKQAETIRQGIKDQSKGNINLLAFKLFKSDGKGGETNLSPTLAIAAIEELLRRGADEKHADYKRFSRLRGKALLYKAKVLDTQGTYGDAIASIEQLLKENAKTAYFFKAMTLKAQIQRKMKKYNDAMKTIGEVVTKASVVRNRYKKEYWTGILEFGRIYSAMEGKASAKAAKTPLEQCKEGITTGPESADIQIIREGAIFELFKVYKKLGDAQKAIKLQTEYLQTYPEGAYRKMFNTVK